MIVGEPNCMINSKRNLRMSGEPIVVKHFKHKLSVKYLNYLMKNA